MKKRKKPEYPFALPTEFEIDEPSFALASYMGAWRVRAWKVMCQWTQKTWSSCNERAVATLRAWHADMKLLGFQIVEVHVISQTTVDIEYEIIYKDVGLKLATRWVRARVVRETEAFTPHEQGTWGVNPISTLRKIE